MLNLGRLTSFRFGMKDIMSTYEVDESIASSVIATVVAKGSRISIASARGFVLEQEKSGAYPKEVSDEICDLLDKFSTHR